jgi:ABC-type multidrug transport system ATPase subunit
MGPSGAGKTTWINCVVDQLIANKGGCNDKKLRIGYVTQEAVDCFAASCTPKEVLEFHRDTRFREVTDEEIQKILRRTHLQSIQNNPLKDGERNNLSGGERKKVS